MTMVDPGVGTEVFAAVRENQQNTEVQTELDVAAAAEAMQLHAEICRGLGEIAGDGTVVMDFKVVHFRKRILNDSMVTEGKKAIITTADDQPGQPLRELALDYRAEEILKRGRERTVAQAIMDEIHKLDIASRQALLVTHRDL
jgi:hypothetical protein